MELIGIADAHLGTKPQDVENLIQFIQSLDPLKQEIVFLGDLFHIWAGPSKHHTPQVDQFLRHLGRFNQNGGKANLVVGNRDIFFPEFSQNSFPKLPFFAIAGNFLHIQLGSKKISFIHGDTVNSQDQQYLKWRRIVRHTLLKRFFDFVPPFISKIIMVGLEKKLKQTNPEFRRFFPMEEWERYLFEVEQLYHSYLLIVGHFHPKDPIITKATHVTGIVLPDWHASRRYLKIKQSGHYHISQYDP